MSSATSGRNDDPITEHVLPQQRRSEDDELVQPSEPSEPAAPEVPVLTGNWVQRTRRRYLGAGILGISLIGVLVGLELTFTVRTFEALAVLVGFTIVAVIAHTAYSVSAPTRVRLDGSHVEVRRGAQVDDFDLRGPIRRIVTIGRPNRPNWRVRFETDDGRLVELGPTQVDPHVITEVIARYQSSTGIPQQRREQD
jgi:hypothetical protein